MDEFLGKFTLGAAVLMLPVWLPLFVLIALPCWLVGWLVWRVAGNKGEDK
jgi:hypothetical protein